MVQPMPSAVRWVVVDAEAMTHVDYTASRVVMQLKSDLAQAGIELAFARVPMGSAVRLRSASSGQRQLDRRESSTGCMMRFPPSREWASESGENVGETKLDSAIHQVDLFEVDDSRLAC